MTQQEIYQAAAYRINLTYLFALSPCQILHARSYMPDVCPIGRASLSRLLNRAYFWTSLIKPEKHFPSDPIIVTGPWRLDLLPHYPLAPSNVLMNERDNIRAVFSMKLCKHPTLQRTLHNSEWTWIQSLTERSAYVGTMIWRPSYKMGDWSPIYCEELTHAPQAFDPPLWPFCLLSQTAHPVLMLNPPLLFPWYTSALIFPKLLFEYFDWPQFFSSLETLESHPKRTRRELVLLVTWTPKTLLRRDNLNRWHSLTMFGLSKTRARPFWSLLVSRNISTRPTSQAGWFLVLNVPVRYFFSNPYKHPERWQSILYFNTMLRNCNCLIVIVLLSHCVVVRSRDPTLNRFLNRPPPTAILTLR